LFIPHNESDWFGFRVLLAAGSGVLVGSCLCVAFAVASAARNERKSGWTLIAAVPSFFFMLWVLVGFFGPEARARARSQESKTEPNQWSQRNAMAELFSVYESRSSRG